MVWQGFDVLSVSTIQVKVRAGLSDTLHHAAWIHGLEVAERCVPQLVSGIRGFRALHDPGEAANGAL